MIRKMIRRYRAKRALKNIRETLAFFGHDVDNMTDDQLLHAVHKTAEEMTRILRNFGVTAIEARDSLLKLNQAIRESKGLISFEYEQLPGATPREVDSDDTRH